MTPDYFRKFGDGHLPGLLGVEILSVGEQGVESRLQVRREVMAPNGFLHAATVIALADTSCGYGCVALLPKGASGFTTIELKANFLGTAREGLIRCRAQPAHLGRNTQVWDATVSAGEGGKTIALFRCTQMVLWQNPKP
ncbi:MAG TPA: PaaI family thioesterase [Burkholderiales bacterium]